MERYVITIARGFGSGGKQLGVRLAKELGIHCYENRILTLASQLAGEQESKFSASDERLKGGYLQAVLRQLPRLIRPRPREEDFASDDYVYSFEEKIIRGLADTESCVIVGKAADYVLRDYPNVVSLYVEAPRPYCRERIMRRMGVSAEEADRVITRTDKFRAEYYKYYTHGNYWTNPVNYDMTLNPARLGEDVCAALVKECLRRKLGVSVPE